jgi:hypothetical protein
MFWPKSCLHERRAPRPRDACDENSTKADASPPWVSAYGSHLRTPDSVSTIWVDLGSRDDQRWGQRRDDVSPVVRMSRPFSNAARKAVKARQVASSGMASNSIAPLAKLQCLWLWLRTVVWVGYDPALLIKLIKTEGVTFTHGVPTLLQMLLEAAAKANVDLVGLKMVIGGSALPKALAKQAMDRGVDVFAGYGMSETGPLLSAAQLRSSDLSGDPDREVELRTRAGRACPLVDLRIVDTNMKEMAQHQARSRCGRPG